MPTSHVLRGAAVVALLATLGACQTYDFEPVKPLSIGQTQTSVDVQAVANKPNFMLLVDKSGSMDQPVDPTHPRLPRGRRSTARSAAIRRSPIRATPTPVPHALERADARAGRLHHRASRSSDATDCRSSPSRRPRAAADRRRSRPARCPRPRRTTTRRCSRPPTPPGPRWTVILSSNPAGTHRHGWGNAHRGEPGIPHHRAGADHRQHPRPDRHPLHRRSPQLRRGAGRPRRNRRLPVHLRARAGRLQPDRSPRSPARGAWTSTTR